MTTRRTWCAAVLAAVVAASASVGFAADGSRVLVVPFSAIHLPESQQWISRGVQENLVADLGRTSDFVPIAFQGQVIVEDNATAARLGKQASADLVIRGAAQGSGNAVRLTAQLIDAKSGDTVRTALVTGSADDLLKMEDELSAQLRGVATATTAQGQAPAAAPVAAAAQPVQPQIIIIQQPAQQQAYPSYPTYYGQDYSPYDNGWGLGYGWSGYLPVIYYPPVCRPPHGGHDGHGGGHGGGPGHGPRPCPIPTPIHALNGNDSWLPLPTQMNLPLPTRSFAPLPFSGSGGMRMGPSPGMGGGSRMTFTALRR